MFKLFSFYILLIIFSLPVFAENTFITKIENLAERGFSDAQYNLARIYANGESVDQDLIAAEYWFRKSAEQGNLDAQYQLGRMYDSGLGVSINKKEAFKWYSLSAEQGSIDAQYNL
jgi:TPR repeat protein